MTQVEQLQKRNQTLDDYEKGLGLPPNLPPGSEEELQRFLSMDKLDIQQLSASAAIGISAKLTQFSFYFQRCINREKSSKTWADQQLYSIVAEELLQYNNSYLPTDAKIACICKTNTAASEVRKMVTMAQQRINRLEEISGGLKNMSYTMSLVIKTNLGER